MLQGRSGHIATKLANGKVLVTGGLPSFTGGTTNLPAVLNGAMNTAEVYDPVTDSWTAVAGTMSDKRMGHTQIAFAGGTKVLVCGGINGGTTFFGQGVPTWSANADVYDMASNTFSSAGTFTTGRAGHSLTELPNGDILMAGGVVSGLFLIPTATTNCQSWSPSTGGWSSAAAITNSRGMHTAATLDNGNTVVVGGLTGTFLAIAATATVEEHTGSSVTPRADIGTNPGIPGAPTALIGSHQMSRLANGTYLVSGGSDGASASNIAFIFKP
jgi:N-acetylneuraminic acid mutarotase